MSVNENIKQLSKLIQPIPSVWYGRDNSLTAQNKSSSSNISLNSIIQKEKSHKLKYEQLISKYENFKVNKYLEKTDSYHNQISEIFSV